MVWMWASLLLVGVITPAVSQIPLSGKCSDSIPELSAKYVTSSDQCCSSFSLNYLMRLCCTDGATCRCTQSIAAVCPVTTTTTTTTTTTPSTTTMTTAPSTKFCRGSTLADSPRSTGRLLNPIMADNSGACQEGPTVGFFRDTKQVCNGAYHGKDPLTGGVALSTLSTCWDKQPNVVKIGKEMFPLNNCSVTIAGPMNSRSDITLVMLSSLASFFVDKQLESCTNRGCIYNPQNMSTAIDWKSCFIASYGATTKEKHCSATSVSPKTINSKCVQNTTYIRLYSPNRHFHSVPEPYPTCGQFNSSYGEGGHLNKVQVMISDTTHCIAAPPNSQCFISTTGTACMTDNGAPLFCSLSTGEQVFYGMTTVNSCIPDYTAFNVLPVPDLMTENKDQGAEIPLP